MKTLFFLLLFLCSLACFAQQKYPCDLNIAFSISIPNLKFKNCKHYQNEQKIVEAYYIVNTKNNTKVEKYLRERFKMGKLVQFKWAYEIEMNKLGFIKSFKDKNGELLDLQVSMFGEMKQVNNSKTRNITFHVNRNEVPYYLVTITLSKSP